MIPTKYQILTTRRLETFALTAIQGLWRRGHRCRTLIRSTKKNIYFGITALYPRVGKKKVFLYTYNRFSVVLLKTQESAVKYRAWR